MPESGVRSVGHTMPTSRPGFAETSETAEEQKMINIVAAITEYSRSSIIHTVTEEPG